MLGTFRPCRLFWLVHRDLHPKRSQMSHLHQCTRRCAALRHRVDQDEALSRSLGACSPTHDASPTVLRLLFSARNAFSASQQLLECHNTSQLAPVSGTATLAAHGILCHSCQQLHKPAPLREWVSELNPKLLVGHTALRSQSSELPSMSDTSVSDAVPLKSGARSGTSTTEG